MAGLMRDGAELQIRPATDHDAIHRQQRHARELRVRLADAEDIASRLVPNPVDQVPPRRNGPAVHLEPQGGGNQGVRAEGPGALLALDAGPEAGGDAPEGLAPLPSTTSRAAAWPFRPTPTCCSIPT